MGGDASRVVRARSQPIAVSTKLIDEVLDGLRLNSTVFSRMTLLGEWGFTKDALSGAPFHLVLSGQACVRLEGQREIMALGPGDLMILPHGSRHELLAHPQAEAVPWRQLVDCMGWVPWTPGARFKTVDLRFGEGAPATTLISGVFAFGDARRNPLLAALPPLLRLCTSEQAEAAGTVSALVAMLEMEMLSARPGAESVAARLADILFILAIRHTLTAHEALPPGWLRGIADRQIAPAIALIHGSPGRPWSVETLGRAAGMSRSRFAARFQDVVGQAPLEYLTQWRMYQAAGALAEGKVRLAELAASLGYRSDVAFSKAFKRWAGRAPAQYRASLIETGSHAQVLDQSRMQETAETVA